MAGTGLRASPVAVEGEGRAGPGTTPPDGGVKVGGGAEPLRGVARPSLAARTAAAVG